MRRATRRRWRAAQHQRGVERRGRVDLERAHGDVFQPELRLDHLALLGDAHRAVDRSRRLRLDGDVGRPAAAAHAAAAAVEQRDAHAGLAARRDNRLLRLIQRPRRAEAADVLRGVGVADHHFLVPADVRAVPRQRQQLSQHRARVAQVVARSRTAARRAAARAMPASRCSSSTASTSDGARAMVMM